MRALRVVSHFDAAHRLPAHPGKCSKLHGHTWRVEVEVEFCDVELQDGMLMDFGVLHEIVEEQVAKLDHHYLNEALPPPCLPPTAEHLCDYTPGRWVHCPR